MVKVLLIDDEKPVHLAIRSLVDWDAIHAEAPASAYNGREGLEMMKSLKPDIVFVDMNMPQLDGEAFLAAATQLDPRCQFIVISGYDEIQYMQAAIHSHVVDYLFKPIDHQELECALSKALIRLGSQPSSGPTPSSAAEAEAVYAYIQSHYQQEIRLDTLAKHFRISRDYLARLFQWRYGMSVYECALQVRMDRARDLLGRIHTPVEDIARQLGYHNAVSFEKAFRFRYGVTPEEYRSQPNGQPEGEKPKGSSSMPGKPPKENTKEG
ncbi:MAG: response regulator [Clostridia bacterium]|nr:response regulator [Clostridia bacterium]